MGTNLHIIAFNIPFPADYGGVIDVFEKIRALHAEGVAIHLHCFAYDRSPADDLNNYCVSVHYYQRSMRGFSLGLPYIVSSRKNQTLADVLDQDRYPILAEGVHASYYLLQGRWPGRVMAVRLHNVETRYYQALAQIESSPLKKAYYLWESKRLNAWEAKLGASPLPLLGIHPGDVRYFMEHYGSSHASYLPAFTRYEAGHNLTGTGTYILCHGDFSVRDNVLALEWLLDHVWSVNQLPWIVAGRKPPSHLKRFPGIRVEADPSETQMDELIRDAHMHIVHSLNTTGIKIKLLHALFRGRHCVAYAPLLEGTGLDRTCFGAETAEAFKTHIGRLAALPFTAADKQIRSDVLREQFDNRTNARKLLALMP